MPIVTAVAGSKKAETVSEAGNESLHSSHRSVSSPAQSMPALPAIIRDSFRWPLRPRRAGADNRLGSDALWYYRSITRPRSRGRSVRRWRRVGAVRGELVRKALGISDELAPRPRGNRLPPVPDCSARPYLRTDSMRREMCVKL